MKTPSAAITATRRAIHRAFARRPHPTFTIPHSTFYILHSTLALCTLSASALNAQSAYWLASSGSWNTPAAWFDSADSSTANPRNAPAATESAYITGSLSLANFSATTATTIIASDPDTTGALAIGNAGVLKSTGVIRVGAGDGSAATLFVDAGGTLASTAGVVNIAYGANSVASATIAGYAASGPSSIFSVGSGANARGSLSILDGGLVVANTFYVGENGSGLLTIDSGGAMTSSVNSWIGRNAGSSGTAIVNGLWQSAGYTIVGAGGSGVESSLDISGTVRATYIGIGNTNAGSIGHVTLRSGGLLEATSVATSYLGNIANGYGTLDILAGGLANLSSLTIGGSGTGNLAIATGGALALGGNLTLGNTAATGYGSATIAGNLTVTGSFILGNSGAALLAIADGGLAQFNPAATSRIGMNAGSSGTLIIENGGALTAGGISLGYSGNGILYIAQGGTLALDTLSLYVAHGANGTGTAFIDGYFQSGNNGTYYQPVGYANGSNGAIILGPTGTARTAQLEIGRGAGATGCVDIFGAWNISGGNTLIGSGGDGALTIENGGQLISAGPVYVSGSTGSTGALTIIEGGLLTDTNAIIGNQAGATGSAAIAGLWRNSGTLLVGNAGAATLDIAATGNVTATTVYLGNTAGSRASATVAGYLDTGADFRVGNSGAATLTIAAGGTVRFDPAGTARLGYAAGSSGTLLIENGGVFTGGGISVGYAGNGFLHVAQSATLALDTLTLYVAHGANGTGAVLVDGYYQSGNNGTYYQPVGYTNNSNGAFILGATGTALTAQISIGYNPNSTGLVDIFGTWNISTTGNHTIGNAGNGTLIIENGGQLTSAGGLYVSNSNNSTGLVRVEAGATLVNSAARIGGGAATETLTNGAIRVAGLWQNNGALSIGYAGRGALDIAAAGLVNVAGSAYIGDLATATGAATVSGNWQIASTLAIGNNGTGSLSILDGGLVEANTIYVGSYGAGALAISQGATLHATANSWLGRYAGATATATIAGRWTTDGYIVIGNSGPGTQNQLIIETTGLVETTGANGAGYLQNAAADATTNIIVRGTMNLVSHIQNASGAGSRATLLIEDGGHVYTGGDFTNGRPQNDSTATLGIAAGGNLTIAGNYTQNPLSTLAITLDAPRPPDALDPTLPKPYLNAAGSAALSGTLVLNGPGVSTLAYAGDGSGRASQLTGLPILRAAGGLTGDFDDIAVQGGPDLSTLPDYIRLAGLKVTEGGPIATRYDVGYGLAWNSTTDQAHGAFTIAAGKTFNVDVQLTDRSPAAGGTGYLTGWDGKSLVKKGAGTLILSVENTYTGRTTVEAGTLRFEGPATFTLGDLVNNGTIDFGFDSTNSAAAPIQNQESKIQNFRTLRAATLSGAGSYRMTVDIAAGQSDRLIIAGDATGTHRLLLTGVGAMPTGNEPMTTLVTIGGVNDSNFTAGGQINGTPFEGNFDYGLFNYTVETRGNAVVIANTGLDPASFSAIRGVPGAQSALWFTQQDTLTQRLGELRAPVGASLATPTATTDLDPTTGAAAPTVNRKLETVNPAGFAAWSRVTAAGSAIGGGDTDMRKSDATLWSIEAGADYTWLFDKDRATLGAYLTYGTLSQTFRGIPTATAATGGSDLLGAGVYAAWLSDTGWFANATFTAATYKNKFDAADQSYNHVTANYTDRAFGAALEAGYRLALPRGWFLEPAAQGAQTRVFRADYTTTPHAPNAAAAAGGVLTVQSSDQAITRLRASLRLGRAWQTPASGWLELAARTALLRESSSGGEITIGGAATRWRPNLDGTRYEAALSAYWQPTPRTGQIYFDYAYMTGPNYRQPWSLSLGFRLSL